MASQAARGKTALDAKDYETAVQEYTAAIKESPTSPEFFIQRATAYTRMQKHAEALEDAEQGVLNALKRAKKESITEAQFRRGVALYQLGRFRDAEFILTFVKEQQKDHKQADMWLKKCETSLKHLPDDDERAKCSIEVTPSSKTASHAADAKNPTSPAAAGTQQVVTSDVPQQTPVDKIRWEWYQNTENIYFTLLVKGVPKDKAQIDITERSLSISFPVSTGSSYDLSLEPLFAAVVPDKCIKRVMATKIEIILIKAIVGQKWTAIESKDPIKQDSVAGADEEDAVKHAILAGAKPGSIAPSYPTSSKSGPKDWDKVASDLGKSDSNGKATDDDDDDAGGDEANHFFKKLFKGATPEVQRAMMKSYTESNGTALSTNWEEVSKGKVETVPPDGMQAKTWEK